MNKSDKKDRLGEAIAGFVFMTVFIGSVQDIVGVTRGWGYIVPISILLIGMVLWALAQIKAIDLLFQKYIPHWKAGALLGVVVMSIITAIIANYSMKTETGVISSHVPMVSKLQEDLGILVKTNKSIEEKMDKLKKETSDNPRKELSNMGMLWNYETFLETIRNQDHLAFELYAAGGMKMRKDFFNLYIENYFNTASARIIEKYRVLNDGGCPTDINGLNLYQNISNGVDTEKANFLKNLCSSSRVKTQINDVLVSEKKRLRIATESNLNIDVKRSECIEEFNKEKNTRDFYTDASMFSMLNSRTHTMEEALLAKLNVKLMVGELTEMNQFLDESIVEVCNSYISLNNTDKNNLQSIESALIFLD